MIRLLYSLHNASCEMKFRKFFVSVVGKKEERRIMENRVKGYVLGKDLADGVPTWKVRVTDESSAFVGEKLFVASIHGDLELAQGLEVTFLIGVFNGRNREIYHKVLDVAPPVIIPKCDFCDSVAEVGIEVSEYENKGAAEYICCCLPDIMRAIVQGQTSPVIKAKTKKFRCVNFSAGNKQWRKMNGVC